MFSHLPFFDIDKCVFVVVKLCLKALYDTHDALL